MDVEREYPPAHAIEPLTKEALERILGCQVSSFPARYVEAMTHRTAAWELRMPSMERLEFLGDSIISFVVAKYLFETYPDKDEGFYTRIRTRLTCSATLASFGRLLQLDKYVIMDGKSIVSQSNARDKTLEDAFEALVGALYFDRGLAVCRDFFIRLVDTYVDKTDLLENNNNYKDILVKYCQAQKEPLPVFTSNRVAAVHGAGGFVFDASVTVKGVTGRGVDEFKKKAEMKAARVVLLQLGIK